MDRWKKEKFGAGRGFGTVLVVEVLALRALRPRRAGGPAAHDVTDTFGLPAGRSARPDCSQREQFHLAGAPSGSPAQVHRHQQSLVAREEQPVRQGRMRADVAAEDLRARRR